MAAWCGEIRTILLCWWEGQMGQPLWKTTWMLLRKWKRELPEDPAISLPGIYSKELKAESQRDIGTALFTAALFTIAQRWKQATSHQRMNRERNMAQPCWSGSVDRALPCAPRGCQFSSQSGHVPGLWVQLPNPSRGRARDSQWMCSQSIFFSLSLSLPVSLKMTF